MGGLSSKLMSNLRPVTSMFALRANPKFAAPVLAPLVIPASPDFKIVVTPAQVSPLRDPKHLIDAVKYVDERAYSKPIKPVVGQDEKDQKQSVSGSPPDVLNKILTDIVINPGCFYESAYLDAVVAACKNGCFYYLSFFVTKHNERRIFQPYESESAELVKRTTIDMFEGIQAFYHEDPNNRKKLVEEMLKCFFRLDRLEVRYGRGQRLIIDPFLNSLRSFFKTACEAGASSLVFYDLVISAITVIKPSIFQRAIEGILHGFATERAALVGKGQIEELLPETILINLLDLKKRYPHLYGHSYGGHILYDEFSHEYSSVGLIIKLFHYYGLSLFEQGRLEKFIHLAKQAGMPTPSDPVRNRIVMFYLRVLIAFRDRDMDLSNREKFYNELANFQSVFPEHIKELFDLLGALGGTPAELVHCKNIIGVASSDSTELEKRVATLQQRVTDLELALKQVQLLRPAVVAPAAGVSPKAAAAYPFWDAKMDSVLGSGSGSLGSALAAGWRPEP